MSKNCKKHKTDSISPCSNNYNEKIKNKANEVFGTKTYYL